MKFLKCATFTDTLTEVDVESTLLRGLPGFKVVGLAGITIKESEERVKSSLNALNFKFPAQKIIINLSPSDTPKNGSHFDLAIALLIALGRENFESDIFVFGELGLDGALKSTASLFSILLFLSAKVKHAKILVPKQIALKAAAIPNYEVYAVENLSDAVRFFMDDDFAKTCLVREIHPLFKNVLEICGEKYVANSDFSLDFADVKGQDRAKRASLIAAAGMHNIIFEGSPGSGKSMCAKRIRYILPPQSLKEVMLASAYESLNSKDVDFSALRPFRSPHHTSTRSSIFGGGSNAAKVGEIALANGGELFFDEFPHFSKQILESLREPLEDNKILISRVNSKVEYQTKFLFAAAQNPCPCGNLFSKNLTCTCSFNDIKRYKSVISAPILDRIDIYVAMDEISPSDRSGITSSEMSELVSAVFNIVKKRGQSELNGKMSDKDVIKFCRLEKDAKNVFDMAVSRYNLSQRGIIKTYKVARTIADLANREIIDKSSILEALSFRIRNEI